MISLRQFAVVLALLNAFALASESAQALTARVVVVGRASNDATVVRLQEELTLLGLTVEVVVSEERELDLAQLAAEHAARAVARVRDTPAEVDLWISGSEPHDLRVELPSSGPKSAELLALSAVELLRGRLIPAEARSSSVQGSTPAQPAQPPATTPAHGAPPNSATVPRPSVPDARRFSVALSPALLLSPGGVPPLADVRVQAGYRISGASSVHALVIFPVLESTLDEVGGAIRIHSALFGGGAAFELFPPAATLGLSAAVGASGLYFSYGTDARGPFATRGGTSWALLPYTNLGLTCALNARLALRADALLGFALTDVTVESPNEALATFGRPLVALSLGIEAAL